MGLMAERGQGRDDAGVKASFQQTLAGTQTCNLRSQVCYVCEAIYVKQDLGLNCDKPSLLRKWGGMSDN